LPSAPKPRDPAWPKLDNTASAERAFPFLDSPSMHRCALIRWVGALLLGLAAFVVRSQATEVENLRCEGRENPLGVDAVQPRLSWMLESDQRGELQTGYRILAASSPEGLAKDQGNLWDSGIVKSAETLNVPYTGKPPVGAQQIFWKVRSWDKLGQPSAWSQDARWTVGLLNEADWQGARWITLEGEPAATIRFRREFAVRPGLRRAVIFLCGLGQDELTIDGAKATQDLLTPGWTKYNKTCLYDTYDVTAQVQHGGRHALGVLLGNGMYNVEKTDRYTKFTGTFGPLKAIVLLRLEYLDGSTETIPTDARWRGSAGPITYSHVYGGEDYDARLEAPGWDSAGFDDSRWREAAAATGPGGVLRGSTASAPPIRAQEVFPASSGKLLKPGVSVYDLGQNASMMPRIQVRGSAGGVVRIIPAELINPDGSIDRRSCGNKVAYWQYTLAGQTGGETYFPKFFYHGCRYLQVECTAPAGGEQPLVESIEGVAISSSARPAGTFSCSDELFNKTYGLVRWAQRSNLVSVLTDCPHRERLGWLEQTHLNGPALRYNFDLDSFFEKVMNDMADSQTANGLVPTTAPEYTIFGGDFRDTPEWGSAFLLVPWQQYEFTGDDTLLRRYYERMVRYVAYLGTRAKDGIVSYGLSDWYDIGPGAPGKSKLTPKGVTASAFYYQDNVILAKAARLLGKTDDVVKFQAQADGIRTAFNTKFLGDATKGYATGSQCANALPLVLGITPPEDREAVLASIVHDVQTQGLTAGDVGYRYLLRALADGGHSNVIFAMINQSDQPGYGMQLAKGATSLTEAWDANRSSSQNHFMLGQINEWFFHDLAGIQPDPESPGFKHIVIKPAIVGDLAFVKASYDSVHGKIVSAWQRRGNNLSLTVVIPANTTATVFIPTSPAASVLESGRPAAGAPGVLSVKDAGHATVCEIGSGAYLFTSQL
jgi:alpha-L-rhamnosidase